MACRAVLYADGGLYPGKPREIVHVRIVMVRSTSGDLYKQMGSPSSARAFNGMEMLSWYSGFSRRFEVEIVKSASDSFKSGRG
jgi:hypothetical protein